MTAVHFQSRLATCQGDITKAVPFMKQFLLFVVLIISLFSSSCAAKSSSAPQPLPHKTTPTAQVLQLPSSSEIHTDAVPSPQLEQGKETSTPPRELFRQGYLAYQAKKHNEARILLQRASENYPVLADYSLYYLGAISREDSQTTEARTFFQQLLSEYPDSIWAGHAQLELAQLALAEQDWSTAARYTELLHNSKLVSAPLRQEAMLVLAQTREGQGDVSDAYNLYQELRRLSPQSNIGKTAKEHVKQLRAAVPSQFSLNDAQDYLQEIRLLQKEGADADVEELSRQFYSKFPENALRSEVLMLQAGVYKRQGRINDAAATWQEIVDQYPSGALAPVAMANWATLLWNKDRNEEAQALFTRLTQQYPHHEKAAEAWYAIGRIWQDRKDETRAATAYDRLAMLFAGSQLAREGRWRQGWMAYQNADFLRATRIFAALAQSASNTGEGESAYYWQARAYERLGDAAKATGQFRELLRRYPDGYYAMLVEKRLHLTPASLKPGAERTSAVPSLPPRLDNHYRRSQELLALRLPSLARRELDVVRDSMPHDTVRSLFLLTEYSRMEGYASALHFAQSLAQENGGGWLRYLYPQAYWQTVSTQARTKQLDPYLVLALMRQESLFNPEAVSPAQAYGLMQLLPKTAARVTKEPTVAPRSLMDPEFNIDAGTTYLRQLLDLYKGNISMAVAAYNAGENAVDKWRSRSADLELDEFVENISYRETRNYVKLVLRNYRTYQRLYGERAGS